MLHPIKPLPLTAPETVALMQKVRARETKPPLVVDHRIKSSIGLRQKALSSLRYTKIPPSERKLFADATEDADWDGILRACTIYFTVKYSPR
jgi:hypothetical protein